LPSAPDGPLAVLVTGATGLCGAHVAERLAAQPERFAVWTLARRPLDRSSHVRHDLREPVGAGGPLPERLDAIVNCAAAVDERAHGYDVVDDNLRIAFNVAALARDRGVACVANLSSIAVYGAAAPNRPIGEAAPLRPVSSYGLAKLLAETMLSAALPGVAVSHLRLAYVLAPEMPERYFLVRVARRLAAGEPVEVVNGDTTRMSFIEAADVARACEAALLRGAAGALNLVADDRPTAREVMAAIAAHHPASASRWRDVEQPAERLTQQFDTARAKELLGVERIGDPLAAIAAARL
jgi:nucleoside-diphosphate-sugar epimerase